MRPLKKLLSLGFWTIWVVENPYDLVRSSPENEYALAALSNCCSKILYYNGQQGSATVRFICSSCGDEEDPILIENVDVDRINSVLTYREIYYEKEDLVNWFREWSGDDKAEISIDDDLRRDLV